MTPIPRGDDFEVKLMYFFKKFLSPPGHISDILKVRGPGINSSQSKNVGKIQLFMQLSHLSIIFENIWF